MAYLNTQPAARVTICIPTYNAENFITRTLGFATGQTMQDIRIVVSVDMSTDGTLDACQAAAAKDPRIEVVAAKERLGWGGNSAALIGRVDTPYFFFYYHDDILLPQYCDRLVTALEENPQATSANCSVAKLQGDNNIIPAHDFTGSIAERLVEAYQADQVPGAPLRSMTRSDVMPRRGVFETGPDAGLEQAYAFISTLLMSGQAVGVREDLYVRWMRETGYVRGWLKTGYASHRASWERVTGRVVPKIAQAVADPAECKAVLMALGARVEMRLLQLADAPTDRPLPPVHPAIPDVTEDLPPTLSPVLARRLNDIRAQVKENRARVAKTRSEG